MKSTVNTDINKYVLFDKRKTTSFDDKASSVFEY